MENYNLLAALFGSNPRLDLEPHHVAAAVPVCDKEEILNSRRIEKKDKYKEDVEALARHFGGIQSKTELCITLQEILTICPRERKRSDAYNGLLSFLKEKGIVIVIQSRKKNRSGLEENCTEPESYYSFSELSENEARGKNSSPTEGNEGFS